MIVKDFLQKKKLFAVSFWFFIVAYTLRVFQKKFLKGKIDDVVWNLLSKGIVKTNGL